MRSIIRVTCPACKKNVKLAPEEVVIVVDMTEGGAYEPGAYTYICPACVVIAWVPESSLNLVRLQAAGVPVSKTVRSVLDRSHTNLPLTAEDIVDFRTGLWGDDAVFRTVLDEWLEDE